MRHLTREGVGPTLAADVVRARSAGHHGVFVDDAVEPRAVACAWAELEAQVAARVSSECSPWRRCGKRKLENEVRGPDQPIISTMLRHLGGSRSAAARRKKMRDVRKRGQGP